MNYEEEKMKKERKQRGEGTIKYSKRVGVWGPETYIYLIWKPDISQLKFKS